LASQPTIRACSGAAQFVEGGHDVGRSDVGLLEQNPALTHASLDRIVGANRDRGGTRAQVLGDHDAEEVTGQKAHAPAGWTSAAGSTAVTSGRSESPSVDTIA
jgi:hypothetical protein